MLTEQKANIRSQVQWFAMSATFARELKAQAILQKHNVECFVAMKYELVPDGDKGKKTKKLVPAVNNLIFVHCTREEIKRLKEEILYLHYMTRHEAGRNIPITVPDSQMQQFISVCNTHNEKHSFLSPDEVNLARGTRVKIIGGSLDGVEGTYISVSKGKRKRVVVMIQGIIGIMLAHITDGYIQVIE